MHLDDLIANITLMQKAALLTDPRYSDLRTTSKFRSLKSV